MTETGGNPTVNPADAVEDTPEPGELTYQQIMQLPQITHEDLQGQLISILSIVSATAAQVQWLCQQVETFYASMPPFMRKGLVPDGK